MVGRKKGAAISPEMPLVEIEFWDLLSSSLDFFNHFVRCPHNWGFVSSEDECRMREVAGWEEHDSVQGWKKL